MSSLIRSRAWQALQAHQSAIRTVSMTKLFADDPARFNHFSLALDGLLLDYSKNLVTADTMRLLADLARERDIAAQVERMFKGEKINNSEHRAALHTALRGKTPALVDGKDVLPEILETRARMRAFSDGVRNGAIAGHGGKKITDVVNIGIGGSHLGPALCVQALAPYADGPRVHFITNIDPAPLARLLARLDPAATLFIVTSKTFTTLETNANAKSALAWAGHALGVEVARTRFIAVTENAAKAVEFGVAPERVFPIWNWVGGRYSLWSAVGLPIALAVGMDKFEELLAGARAMDEHFRTAPIEKNLPMTLALLGIWYNNFLGAETHAMLPYDDSLALMPVYMQQLDMESSGKEVTRDGTPVDYSTGPIVWGTLGNNAQHAFFQLLHQGTHLVSADFIVACQSHYPDTGYHEILIANFLAQTAALAFGGNTSDAPHDAFPGNHPSNSIMLKKLTPHTLGMLLALYEHKVFAQNAVWDINPFDQPGVELGKRLVARTLPALEGKATDNLDGSTLGLVDFYKTNRN